MTEAGASELPRPGLRERKKQKTRRLLAEHAIRLFRANGYAETTVEQVADAADVSPATVYRYFPTKADLVIYDDLDERMIDAFRALPSELGAIEALRLAMRRGFESFGVEDLALQSDRERLLRTEPELRAALLDDFVRTLRLLAEMIAERSGRAADDETVLSLAGAVIGLAIAIWLGSGEDIVSVSSHYLDRLDDGLVRLETGFQL